MTGTERSTPGRGRGSAATRDLVLLSIGALVAFALAARFDVLERFVAWAAQYEALEVDEWATSLALLPLALSAFAVRRWLEVRAEVAARKRTEGRLRRVAATLAAVGAAPDLAAAMRALLQGAVDVLGGTSGALVLPDSTTGNRHRLRLRADGTMEERTNEPPPPPGSNQWRLLQGEGPILVTDYERLDPAAYPWAERMRALGYRSAVNVSIDTPGPAPHRIGSLHVNSDQPGQFDQDDLDLAAALASQAAGSVERARLLEVERERQRLEGALLVARTAAHQINNALTPVAGFAELLAAHPAAAGDPTLTRYAQAIGRAAADAAERVRLLGGIVRLEDDTTVVSAGEPVLDLERSAAAAPASASLPVLATVASTESEPLLAGVMDVAADAVVVVDEDQRILLFNQGAERTFGWRVAEVLGQPLDLLLPPRFAETHREHVRAFAAAPGARGMAIRRTVVGQRKDGTEFPAEASIATLSQHGQTICICILRDLAERVRWAQVTG